MGKTKHEKSFVDFEQPYEQNVIGLKGILYFGIGLFLLIVITFSLMWVFMKEMAAEFKPDRTSTHPMAMNDTERLPPEPRLQLAPGFKFNSGDETVILELKPPNSEFLEFRKTWDEVWEHGEKDPKTGTMIAMPIEEAKEKFLEEHAKARSGEEAQKTFDSSRMFVSDSSSGRRATETRR